MDDSAGLAGTHCAACGHRSFPAQDYGCERCGAHGDALRPVALSGAGVLVSAATVHRHAGDDVAVPFTAVSVLLDDGPQVTGLLDAPGEPPPGTRMRAVTTAGETRFAVAAP